MRKILLLLLLVGTFAVSQPPNVYRIPMWDGNARRWFYPTMDMNVFLLSAPGTADPSGTISVRVPTSQNSRVYSRQLIANSDYTYTMPVASPKNVVVWANDFHMAPDEFKLVDNILVPNWNWPLGSNPVVVVDYDP